MFVAVRVNFSKLKPLPLSITDQNGTPAATIVTSATRRRLEEETWSPPQSSSPR
jgi:hypothetical protein